MAGEDEDSDNEDGLSDQETSSNTHKLAPLPDTNSAAGVLPRVIKTLVDRRRCIFCICFFCTFLAFYHLFDGSSSVANIKVIESVVFTKDTNNQLFILNTEW